MIRIDDVDLRYRAVEALAVRELSLGIAAGEVVVLCGGSGSGKSSVLRLMNGLVPHFHDGDLRGQVTVADEVVADLPLERLGRLTGTVQQQPRRQFFTDRVVEEVAFALESNGVGHPQLATLVREALVDHGLAALVDRRLGQLSGGQQQQVACAAATAHQPAVVLLDEPTANLAAPAVARVVDAVDRLRRAGSAVVIAEHRVAPFASVADRFVVMTDGTITTEWDRAEFARLDDAELASHGLRGTAPTVNLPAVAASGASVEASAAVRTAGDSTGAGGIVVRGLRCVRAGRTVLDLDEARLPAGRVTAVRGPNGAGKTTLGRVLAGLQSHRGEVLLDGRRQSRGDRRQRVAMVQQDPLRQLFTESVAAEVALPVGQERAGHDAGHPLVDLELDGLGDRHPLALSGGQQQRLVLATAALQRRPVVVLDEPSSGVDRRHLTSIATMIAAMAESGAVVVLISHDEDLLALAADGELQLAPVGRGPDRTSGDERRARTRRQGP